MRALQAIGDKVAAGQRVSEQETRDLYECIDLLELGRVASLARQQHDAEQCNLVEIRRVRYSNVCRNQCRHCDLSCAPGAPDAFTRSVDAVADLVGEAVAAGMDQIQLVGGSNPDAPYDYYLDMVSTIRALYPDIHMQGFAPEQLANIATFADLTMDAVLNDLLEAGLDSVLEDGADIFNHQLRTYLCPAKATGGMWLHAMREAHELGFHTGASMLYGHCEGPEAKAEHLTRLRDLQDDTHGFTFFAPRAYRPNGKLKNGNGLVGGTEDIREFAVGRIALPNVPHIRCYSNDLGMKTTQIALQFGVDTAAVVVHDGEPIDDG